MDFIARASGRAGCAVRAASVAKTARVSYSGPCHGSGHCNAQFQSHATMKMKAMTANSQLLLDQFDVEVVAAALPAGGQASSRTPQDRDTATCGVRRLAA